MTLTEAQKRAMKKWREANKEAYNSYRNEWIKNNPESKEKQREYDRKYKARKKDFLEEFKRLSSIEII